MKNDAIFKTIHCSVETRTSEIDYFKIPVMELKQDGFSVTSNQIKLATDEWLSVNNHLSGIDRRKKETIAFNIQVGKGKTTACYQLIAEHMKLGHIVIVCSPFKRLVRKDFQNLTKLGLYPFNYETLEETFQKANEPGYHFNFEPHIDHDVHVMTINCLLQNPGNDSYEQQRLKQIYLSKLFSHAKYNDRKVVMFFDEVHESVHNFHDELVPNLFKWKDVIHKAYVSSATFTPAAIPVLKYIAALTDGQISVYETPRQQIKNPTSLHLHFTRIPYGANNLEPLAYLTKIIEFNSDKNVNILTGHKSMAKALINIKTNPTDPVVKAISALNPNLLTGEDEGDFLQSGNNIGTTFKTGVDIENHDSIFVIIMPCVSEKNESYGIFSDGLPSIIQSLARIRHTGQVHVFMYLPSVIIEKPKECDLFYEMRIDHLPSNEFTPQNSLYEILIKQYNEKRDAVGKQISEINSLEKSGLKLQYKYSSLSENMIEKSTNLLVKNSFSYGKRLSPYVLWAALNNQFCTSKLQQITYTKVHKKVTFVTKEDIGSKFSDIFRDSVLNNITKQRIPELAFQIISIRSNKKSVLSNDDATTHISYEGEVYSLAEMAKVPFLMQALVSRLCSHASDGKINSVKKSDYILGCTVAAESIKEFENERAKHFSTLAAIRKVFLEFIKSKTIQLGNEKLAIPQDAYLGLDDNFVKRVYETITNLKNTDLLIGRKVYQFGSTMNADEESSTLKRKVYGELRDCFSNITSERCYPKGKGLVYFKIDGKIEREHQPGFEKLILI